MDESISLRLATIIANLSTPVLFNGKFKVVNTPISNVDKVLFGQKIANIVVAGSELRMIFKIHYTTELGKILIESTGNDLKISEQGIDDFFLESCNLAAGRIKSSFSGQETNLGISIPIKTKAFDDLFFNIQTDGEFCSEWHWDAVWEEYSVHLSVFLELLNLDLKIDPSLEETQQVDELEFF